MPNGPNIEVLLCARVDVVRGLSITSAEESRAGIDQCPAEKHQKPLIPCRENMRLMLLGFAIL